MAAYTEVSSNATEFAGNYKVVVVKVDGATGTTNTVTVDELSTVVGAFTTLAAAPTADAAEAVVTGISNNVITATLYEDDHATACTRNAIDFYILAIGY